MSNYVQLLHNISLIGQVLTSWLIASFAVRVPLQARDRRDDMPQEKPGPHHDHPGHKAGDLDQHGHRDKSDKR